MAKPKPTTKKTASVVGDCAIPPEPPKEELHKFLFKSSAAEAAEIKKYVESQTNSEDIVLHTEKVESERVVRRQYDLLGRGYRRGRWWVLGTGG
jgi:hypothetical protein